MNILNFILNNLFFFYFLNKNDSFFKKIKNYLLIDIFYLKSKVFYFLNNWVYTTNHKKIAVNYFWFVILAGIVGTVLATIIRLEMAYPGVGILSGDSIQYLSIVTAHGVIMVFFMIIPLLFGAFGNFLLPSQLGVHDVAFPRLNSAAFWFLPAGLIMLCQLVCIDKRYHKINCFNISEAQSLLKKKFFNDLVISNDFKKDSIINSSKIKYNLNDINIYNNKFFLENNFLSENPSNFTMYNTLNYYFFKKPFNYFSHNNIITSIFESLFNQNSRGIKCNLKFNFFEFDNFLIIFNFYYLISLFSINTTAPSYLINLNFLTYKKNADISYNNNVEYLINNYGSTGSNKRFTQINYLKFKYDYKNGNYLSDNSIQHSKFLINSKINTSNNKRFNSWFFSDLISINFFKTNNLNNLYKNLPFPKSNILDIFYLINRPNSLVNNKFVSNNQLNQKFNKLFLSSGMQQRIYGNWRELKFSRESWRTKLLVSRHQKTLYNRYLNEDNFFWTIERNAKDLLPGWAMITPFSSRIRYTAIGKTDIGLFGVFLTLNASIISSSNFLLTYRYLSTLNNRKMRDARSFFSEAIMVTSLMMVAANPMLILAILMLLCDRHLKTSFFDYSGGGDTVLFQHMFWFFGHPEVYVVVMPVFGFTNTILSSFLKKRISARTSLIYSLYTIAFLGFFVWGHHMYMVGLAHTTRMLFSTLTVMISVPAATKLMHWSITLVNSSFHLEYPLVLILIFIFLFVSGGISGMCVAHTGMDVLFHDTLYVIGHFHIMFAGAAMFGSFAAFYFYFPSIFGVKYSRIFAYFHLIYYLIGHLMTFIPLFWLGYAGMPRRILDYPSVFGGWHAVASSGHILALAGIISFFIMIFDSMRQSKNYIKNMYGIGRYNVRINFYLYEIYRLNFINQKSLSLLNTNKKSLNLEHYDSTLISYSFIK